jgi:hypothetical protein
MAELVFPIDAIVLICDLKTGRAAWNRREVVRREAMVK